VLAGSRGSRRLGFGDGDFCSAGLVIVSRFYLCCLPPLIG
jgi:hypothetical protein